MRRSDEATRWSDGERRRSDEEEGKGRATRRSDEERGRRTRRGTRMSEEGDEEGRGCSHVNHTDLLLLLLLPFVVHHGNGTAWQRERTVDGVLVLFCRRR